MKRILLSFCFILSLLKLNAQQSSCDTIPFTLTDYNNISIECIINQVDTVQLMFHTATNGVSLTHKALEQVNSVKTDSTFEAKAWGGNGEMGYSLNNNLEIKNLKWDSLLITSSKHSGHYTDGKLGIDFFSNKIIEIDYERKWMILHNDLPEFAKDFQRTNLEENRYGYFISGAISISDKEISHQYLMHSGYSGSILFDDEFAAKHQISKKVETIKETELKDSFGNVLKTKKVIVPGFTLGSITMDQINAGLFEGAMGRQKMSVLGGDVLKRFHIVLDLKNANIYLKPNSLFQSPYFDS